MLKRKGCIDRRNQGEYRLLEFTKVPPKNSFVAVVKFKEGGRTKPLLLDEDYLISYS